MRKVSGLAVSILLAALFVACGKKQSESADEFTYWHWHDSLGFGYDPDRPINYDSLSKLVGSPVKEAGEFLASMGRWSPTMDTTNAIILIRRKSGQDMERVPYDSVLLAISSLKTKFPNSYFPLLVEVRFLIKIQEDKKAQVLLEDIYRRWPKPAFAIMLGDLVEKPIYQQEEENPDSLLWIIRNRKIEFFQKGLLLDSGHYTLKVRLADALSDRDSVSKRTIAQVKSLINSAIQKQPRWAYAYYLQEKLADKSTSYYSFTDHFTIHKNQILTGDSSKLYEYALDLMEAYPTDAYQKLEALNRYYRKKQNWEMVNTTILDMAAMKNLYNQQKADSILRSRIREILQKPEQLVTPKQDLATLYGNRAYYSRIKGHLEKCLVFADSAIALDTTLNSNYRIEKGHALYGQGKSQQAKNFLQDYLKQANIRLKLVGDSIEYTNQTSPVRDLLKYWEKSGVTRN